MPRRDGFLNVDLELGARTRAQLAPLIEALPRGVHEIFRGRIRGVYRVDYAIYRVHRVRGGSPSVSASWKNWLKSVAT